VVSDADDGVDFRGGACESDLRTILTFVPLLVAPGGFLVMSDEGEKNLFDHFNAVRADGFGKSKSCPSFPPEFSARSTLHLKKRLVCHMDIRFCQRERHHALMVWSGLLQAVSD
jgi:hypothetical protein